MQTVLVFEHVAAVESRAGQGILHGGLMFEDKERNDITAVGEVIARVKKRGEIGDVGAARGIENQPVGDFVRNDIPAVKCISVPAGDVPTAPSFGKGGLEIDDLTALAENRFPVFVRVERAGEHGGYAAHKIAAMATHAVILAGKFRRVLFVESPWIKGIKDGAEFGIYRGDFNEATGHPTDVAIVRVV